MYAICTIAGCAWHPIATFTMRRRVYKAQGALCPSFLFTIASQTLNENIWDRKNGGQQKIQKQRFNADPVLGQGRACARGKRGYATYTIHGSGTGHRAATKHGECEGHPTHPHPHPHDCQQTDEHNAKSGFQFLVSWSSNKTKHVQRQ